MKKHVWRLAGLILGTVLLGSQFAYAGDDINVEDYYAATVDDYAEIFDSSLAKYGLFDMDDDGVDELLLSSGNSEKDWSLEIYTILDEDVVYAGEVPGRVSLYAYEFGDGILAVSKEKKGQTVQLLTLDLDTVETETLLEEDDVDPDDVFDNDNRIVMKPLRLFGSAYLLPKATKRYITKDDLRGFDDTLLQLARNEFYARHGRIFITPYLRDYFEKQSWYHGRIKAKKFSESVFNKYEDANIALILRYENAVG